MNIKILLIMLVFLASYNLTAKTEINETHSLSDNGRIHVDNISGSITLNGWDKNEVKIQGSYSGSVEKVDITSSSNTIRIKVVYRLGLFFKGKCDLEIFAPRNGKLDIDSVSAKINISGFKSSASIDSVSGDIVLSGDFTSLDVDSTSGDVELSGNAETLEINTTSGDVDITGSGEEIDFSSISGSLKIIGTYPRIKGDTISGSVDYKGKAIDYCNINTTSGSVNIDCIPNEKADLNIQTTSGTIDITVPSEISARLKFESFSGTIKVIGIDYENSYEEDFMEISKTLKTTIGNGDVKIYLQTLSGSIKLKGK